jgi:hypothetical protein
MMTIGKRSFMTIGADISSPRTRSASPGIGRLISKFTIKDFLNESVLRLARLNPAEPAARFRRSREVLVR